MANIIEVGDPEPGFRFAVGQKVYCHHDPLMYEARCVKTDKKEGVPQYLIHYHGWNKNWDEWVPESRLVEFTDENKRRAEQMSRDAKNQKRGSGVSKVFKRKSTASTSESVTSTSSIMSTISAIKVEKDPSSSESIKPTTGGKESTSSATKSNPSASVSTATPTAATSAKQPKDEQKQSEVMIVKVPGKKGRKAKVPRVDLDDIQLVEHNKGVRIEIPPELADILIDDMHYVAQQNMILKLQETKSVQQVLNDYVKKRKEEVESKKSINGGIKAALEEKGGEQNGEDKITELACYDEVCSGIKRYFNEMLGSQLLYKYERPQFAGVLRQIVSKDGSAKDETETATTNGSDQSGSDKFRPRKNSSATRNATNNSTTEPAAHSESAGGCNATDKLSPSVKQHLVEYYTPIHLLRLCTKLDKILAAIQMDEKAVKIIVSVVCDLLVYLKEERDQLFSPSHYTSVPPDYDRMAT